MRWRLAAVVAIVPHAMALAARRKKPRRPPRLALGAITERTTFSGTLVERSDLRRRAHAPPERAVCLADVTTNGAVVADHCWLRGADARCFDRVQLDTSTSFDADVETYRKRGRRDYRLARVDGVS